MATVLTVNTCLGAIGTAAVTLLIAVNAVRAEDIDHGRRVFRTCASCHVADTETNKLGPHLKGVVGRRAASVTQFRYSNAMQKAGQQGLVWDEAALAAFLSSPKAKVPGTSMRFWGLWTDAEIRDVIAYLRANH